MSEKLPPHNLEAEESLLGSILIDEEQLSRIDLVASDFFDESHQAIYQAMLNLYKLSEGIDQITVSHELLRQGRLEQIGGSAYLSHLISVIPTSLHAPYYAKVVKDCSLNREIINAAGRIAQVGYENKDPLESLDKSRLMLHKISKVISSDELLTPAEIAEKANERYSTLRSTKLGLSTGFEAFDRKTGGFFDGDYIVIASRPGVGKTSLALQTAEAVASSHNALFVSLEMMPEGIIDKLVARLTDKPVRFIRRGSYDDALIGEIILSLAKISELNLYLCHGPATTASLRRVMERMKLSYGLDIAFIDYLQLLRDRYGSNANERIGFISGELASMAKEFNIPLVVLSQLSRAPDDRMDKRPHLADLRESGAIEQDADLIMFLYRDSYYDHKVDPDGAETEVLISKDRLRGLTGKFKLYWDAKGERYVNNKGEITGNREGEIAAKQ